MSKQITDGDESRRRFCAASTALPTREGDARTKGSQPHPGDAIQLTDDHEGWRHVATGIVLRYPLENLNTVARPVTRAEDL